MKIFLPFQLRDIGGTSTFAAKFKIGMERRGHTVSFAPMKDYDVLFLIVQAPLHILRDAKRRGKPIVQRLDGVWYWSVAGGKFPLLNARAAYIRQFFTDTTIYQSEYSKLCAERFLGKKAHERSALIYNGVDLDHFSPTGPRQQLRDSPGQQIFFTASAFRRTDQILPLIAAFEHYRASVTTNCKLVLAGSFVGEVAALPKSYRMTPYVQFLGRVTNEQLPSYERGADVFLFTHLNPPCPNNVLEAMACGLPICGIADGAMTELVEDGVNGLLLPSRGQAFWKRRTIYPEAFAAQMRKVFDRRDSFGKQSRHRAELHFSIERMIDAYLQVLTSI